MIFSRSRMRAIASWTLVAVITLAVLEVVLRFGFRAQLDDLRTHILESEQLFFERDGRVGWSPRPGAVGVFTNGAYRAAVHIDARGVRQNAAKSTWDPAASTIFMIGDSNMAEFEVDDEETIPALIEKRLRARGERVNVVNLGVRDYGTDQAVLRALAFRELNPRTILYLFTNNDPFDNNLLHLPGRRLGKGVFIRRAGEAAFSTYNYPVPEYATDEAGVVLLDRQCAPVVHERTIPEEPRPPFRLFTALKEYSWTARAVSYIRRGPPVAPLLLADPVDLILGSGLDFHPDLYTTFHEQGPVRSRCPEYFDAQIADLLGRLREIPSIEKVLVAHFPDNEIFDDVAKGRGAPSITMFNRQLRAGIVDGYLNLTQKFVEAGLSYPKLACPGDGHLCAKGIRWEADQIFSAFFER